MQFSFWQVYYCSSAISFFDGFRSLPCFSATSKRRTAVGLLLRLLREIFAIHRYRTVTHNGLHRAGGGIHAENAPENTFDMALRGSTMCSPTI